MTQQVVGHFTSEMQARWAMRDLRDAGFTQVTLDETAGSGAADLIVDGGTHEADALGIMARHGAEWMRRMGGGQIGDVSNAPREGDNEPVITEPLVAEPAPVQGAASSDTPATTERPNLSQSTGQFYDMMRSQSDDGTVPPTSQREAITTPPLGKHDRTVPGARSGTGGAPVVAANAPPAASGPPETPLQRFAARPSAEETPDPAPGHLARARSLIVEPADAPGQGSQLQDMGDTKPEL